MKAAIIADVHSNLPALEAVLKQIRGMPIFCCGDLVGYNPYPNEVIELVKKEKIFSILGNHDNAVLTGDTSWFNPTAAAAIEWTIDELSEDNKEFLRSLPLKYEGDFYMVHGSPKDPLEEYVHEDFPDYVFKDFFNYTSKETIILGHTHILFIKKINGKVVFNPGGVGQPRDGDPRASFAVFDTDTKEVEIRRAKYDIETVAKAITEKGLPEKLALRLFYGF